ncbi:MAG TPA: ammonium transporter, partial [Methanophagales archaeon]|nr:ammonium transporter [Methanophagales archaeon]
MILILFILSFNLFATETSQENLDIVWIVIATALVFLMQAGFTAFEAGLVRAKNSINVAVKNFSDLTFAIIAYFLIGFALMF